MTQEEKRMLLTFQTSLDIKKASLKFLKNGKLFYTSEKSVQKKGKHKFKPLVIPNPKQSNDKWTTIIIAHSCFSEKKHAELRFKREDFSPNKIFELSKSEYLKIVHLTTDDAEIQKVNLAHQSQFYLEEGWNYKSTIAIDLSKYEDPNLNGQQNFAEVNTHPYTHCFKKAIAACFQVEESLNDKPQTRLIGFGSSNGHNISLVPNRSTDTVGSKKAALNYLRKAQNDFEPGYEKKLRKIISSAAADAKQGLNEYFVVYILINSGNIRDYEDVKNELKKVSNLPLSFIFVKIGPNKGFEDIESLANFTKRNILGYVKGTSKEKHIADEFKKILSEQYSSFREARKAI